MKNVVFMVRTGEQEDESHLLTQYLSENPLSFFKLLLIEAVS